MSEKDNGGPAFPVNELNQGTGQIWEQHMGLSLRDYFAAKAMQAMVTAEFAGAASFAVWASQAYEQADEMLKAREI